MLVCMEVETTSQNQLKGGHVRSKNCGVAIAIVYVAIKLVSVIISDML